MLIRYFPADPAGNLTGFVLSPVPRAVRPALSAALMRRCPERFEQIGYIDSRTLASPLPRMEMMGGEFCGNASRAFGLYCARLRESEGAVEVSVSGAAQPILVETGADTAYARMPIPYALEEINARSLRVPVVRMEGIAHAVLEGVEPSQALADDVLAAMPEEDAQGVLFAEGTRMTPYVFVPATGTGVWESSCGSGSVALAWLLARKEADGETSYRFSEPGGELNVRVTMEGGKARRIMMGGAVKLGEEREIEIEIAAW